MDYIIKGLFVGDALGAKNKEKLQANGITHILNVTNTGERHFPSLFEYKVVAVEDFETVDIKRHFKECIQFITAAHNQGGSVLVHCYAGLSRSVTVVAAYLMQTHKMRATEALMIIQ